MIHVDRSRVSPPPKFFAAAQSLLDKSRLFFNNPDSLRSQSRPAIFGQFVNLKNVVRPALIELFHGKCAYCESSVAATGSTAVDHFRPRMDAANLDRKISPIHYWWLMATWDNLYLACLECNRYKRNLFPVRHQRAVPESFGQALESEGRLLIDPCNDEPEQSFAFQPNGQVEPLDEHAKVTIEVLQLNRPSLVHMRRDHYARITQELGLWISSQRQTSVSGDDRLEAGLRDRLLSYTHSSAPYAAVARQALRHVLHRLRGDALHTEVPPAQKKIRRGHQIPRKLEKAAESLRTGWISRIEIENFRGIDSLALDFPRLEHRDFLVDDEMTAIASPSETEDPDIRREPWLMLIGPNGVGKSSVLKAVALALVDEPTRNRLIPDASSVLNQRSRSSTGVVFVRFDNGESVRISFSRRSRTFRQQGGRAHSPLLAYGSTRLLSPGTARLERPRSVRVDNLFHPRTLLGDAEKWLADTSQLLDSGFDLLARSLKDLLSLDDEDRVIRQNGRLLIEMSGSRIPLHELSDGYQSIVALATHIMVNLSRGGFALEHVAGTVLLDELEVHLHPTWKIRIVRSLRRVFPRVRFITTTHDPLCLRGLESGEVYHLDREPESKRVRAIQLDVPPGLRVDQLLTGQWFGLSSTLDADTLALMEKHQSLLARRRLSATEQLQLEQLSNELQSRLSTFADTSLDRMALSVAAQLMASTSTPLTPDERTRLREGIRQALSEKAP
ncbi:AAA family ATPase [Hyalangium minutum]|uniref:AAA+ ATPase domain-containing protein n=1 Tax=Hyalangium minutum TaxID=394096 RepID=A0A085WIE1_9BACT|nr:AAA family ATPase [Hyalangium minutum]KFE67454.1 hypothetical protein DB31_8807 [Hyalangium minutum]